MYNEGVKAYFENFFYDPKPVLEAYQIEGDKVTVVFGVVDNKGNTLESKMITMDTNEIFNLIDVTRPYGAEILLSELSKHRK